MDGYCYPFWQAASYGIWNIPEGFATLISAIAILLAAFLAWIAAKSGSSTQIELDMKARITEQKFLKLAIASELLGYSRSIIDIMSLYNSVTTNKSRIFPLPSLPRPVVFEASINRVGELNSGPLISSVLTFYANLSSIREEHDSRYLRKEEPTMSTQAIGQRFRLMAGNLATALTMLLQAEPIGLPKEIDINFVIGQNGEAMVNYLPQPTNIPEVLRLL